MKKWEIIAEDAPFAIGPYSQAIRAGELVFVSGQLPIDPSTNEMVTGTVSDMTRRVFANIEAILLTADSGLDGIVKVTVYLQDLADFAEVNAVFEEVFPTEPPARETVQVARLPKDSRLEVSAVAVAKGEGE